MLNKTAPELSSENLFMFRVALTYPGSSSGLQIPLPVQHIPLSPCIRAHCGQGCVCASDTLLVPSWMSHLVTVLWPSLPTRKRTADQACPSPNLMEQLQGQNIIFFFHLCEFSTTFCALRIPCSPVTKLWDKQSLPRWLLPRSRAAIS